MENNYDLEWIEGASDDERQLVVAERTTSR